MSMLELRAVRAGYGRLPVLFDVDFTIDPGEWVTVLGANGSGRSTLLKAVLGVVDCTAGEIHFRGERITHDAPHRRVAAGISMSPEGRHVFPTLSVRENLVAGTYGLPSRAEVPVQLQRVYDVFPKLADRAGQRAGSLSGGEQQMLAIGRALMSEPRLLLVDELSLGLAPIIVQELFASLDKLRELGLGIVVVDQLHAHGSLARYSDRQLILEKGRFVERGSWDLTTDALARAGTT
ncbi:MAG TPA: ABC transporter ATP-binding protein [Acidimicrobiia bacterium]|nr:ABC transporter ATP-binding protein [Acidimicrobiia bacterium]